MRIVIALLCVGGCSFVAIRRPNPVGLDETRTCDSNVLPVVDTVFGAVTIGSAAFVVNDLRQSDDGSLAGLGYLLGTVQLLNGLVYTASAIYGYTTVSKCERSKRDQIAARDARHARIAERTYAQERAWAQTQAAAAAAREGDCATVAKLDSEVRTTDAEFHRTVFLRDAAITRCGVPEGASTRVAPQVVPPVASPSRDPIRDRERAFALTKAARQAAGSADCATVRDLQRQVRELDANVHDAWFVRDDKIKACLAPL